MVAFAQTLRSQRDERSWNSNHTKEADTADAGKLISLFTEQAKYFEIYNITMFIHTFKTSHPIKRPSSNPRILFPLKSSSSKAGRLWNSAVENIGFRLSPKRLSARTNLVIFPRIPASSRSGSLRRLLCEKSSSFSGRPYDEKIWKRNNQYRQQKYASILMFYYAITAVILIYFLGKLYVYIIPKNPIKTLRKWKTVCYQYINEIWSIFHINRSVFW